MLIRRFLPWVAGILLVVAFGYGVLHLFALRFAQGDVYPPYSSLRSDPLGTKALFDALGSMPSLETTRNFRPLTQLKPVDRVTLFYIGVPNEAKWGKSELRYFETLVGGGSRAVFAFAAREPAEAKKPDPKKDEATPVKEDEKAPPKENDNRDQHDDEETALVGLLPFAKVAERWGVTIARVEREKKSSRRSTKSTEEKLDGSQALAHLADTESELEDDLPYRSAIYFKDLAPPWRVLYRMGEHPVLIERPWGDGSLVLVGDPYFLSNEALRDQPHPSLLAWLAGSAGTVIFEEEHHGITESTGIASLAQKYRLQGAIVALLSVIALAIWRSSVPFVRGPQEDDDERVEGRDAAEAFTSLLRRSVAPAGILEVCLAEWRKSFSRSLREVAAVDAALAAESALPVRERNPVAAYRRISEALTAHSPKAK